MFLYKSNKMKMKFNFYIILILGLISIVITKDENTKKKKITTEITITTTSKDEEESEDAEPKEEYEEEPIVKEEIDTQKNGTESEVAKEETKQSEKIEPSKEVENKKREEKNDLIEEEQNEEGEEDQKKASEKESENSIREAEKNTNVISPDKILVLKPPYQDNEDYVVTPLGLGTPVNFAPLQVDTTSYKTWVASALNEDSSLAFTYDKKDSKSAEEPGEWDTVVDEEGTISGNVIYDKAHFEKFEINHFKFIEAVEFEDDFHDYKNGKLGLGNCYYADHNDLEYCLLQRLKDNGSIERRIFSMREYSDTHGEIVIGDVTSVSKENDYPLLPVVEQDIYEDIEDDEFKMSWITKVSHIIFKNSTSDKVKNIFKNNIYIKEGLASFDSSSHYIEAPYSYINDFQEQMFDKFYPNVCRKVNNDGTYMFLCNKERFDEIKNYNKDLSFIIVMDGNGFEIPMDFLFEQTRENDYEFFVHFKDYEQNIWNLGHPFFHHFTIIFDLDNQEIGVDGQNIYNLKDETEAVLRNKGGFGWWKIFLLILVGLLLLAGVFWLLRKYGIQIKLDNGTSPSLVDNESVDDLSFGPSQNVH